MSSQAGNEPSTIGKSSAGVMMVRPRAYHHFLYASAHSHKTDEPSMRGSRMAFTRLDKKIAVALGHDACTQHHARTQREYKGKNVRHERQDVRVFRGSFNDSLKTVLMS